MSDQLDLPRKFSNSVELLRVHVDEVVHRVDGPGPAGLGLCLRVVLDLYRSAR